MGLLSGPHTDFPSFLLVSLTPHAPLSFFTSPRLLNNISTTHA